MKYMRKLTREVKAGNIFIGGGHPVSIQSMTNTESTNIDATVEQINKLKSAGCDIVRISVYNEKSAEAIKEIKSQTNCVLVADIHFNSNLATLSIKNGIDKLRINPGNIGGAEKVKALAECAKDYGVPIRIGVNSGSVEKHLLRKYGGPTPEALVESALCHVNILENVKFYDIVISVKSSSVSDTVKAYRILSQKTDYPLHLGVTEAGTRRLGTVKSAIGIGALLLEGIGDTIRVSLSGDPVNEVIAAKDILTAVGLRNDAIEIISCPTCGRCSIDVEKIALEAEKRVAHIKIPFKLAVMGCIVNGPGEAEQADLCICGAGDEALIIKKGEIIDRIPQGKAVDTLVDYIEKISKETTRG